MRLIKCRTRRRFDRQDFYYSVDGAILMDSMKRAAEEMEVAYRAELRRSLNRDTLWTKYPRRRA